MKLDRHIIDLLSLFEKAEDKPSYTYVPQLIREEIVEIRWKPIYTNDEHGGLQSINHSVEVIYNVKDSKVS
jgi:hypothetical protein